MTGEPGRRQVGARRGRLRRRHGLRVLRGRLRPAARHLGRSARSATSPAGGWALVGGDDAPRRGLRASSTPPARRADRARRRGPALGRRRVRRRAALPRAAARGDAAGAVLTYRDHEIGPQHSPAPLLGDVAELDGFTTLHAGSRSASTAVTPLVAAPASTPTQVHALTGGNPFFVAEVAKDPGRPLPANGPGRRPGPHRRRRPATSRCSSSPPPPPTGSTTGCSRRWVSTCRRCGGCTTPACCCATARPGLPPRAGPARRGEHRPGGRRGAAARPAARGARAGRAARPGGADPPRGGGRRRRPAPRRTPGRRPPRRPGGRAHRGGGVPRDRPRRTSAAPPPGERAQLLTRARHEQYMTSQPRQAIATSARPSRCGRRPATPPGCPRRTRLRRLRVLQRPAPPGRGPADRAAAIAGERFGGQPTARARATRGYLAYMPATADLARECPGRRADRRATGDEALALRAASSAPPPTWPAANAAPGAAGRPRSRTRGRCGPRRARLDGLLQPRLPRRRAAPLPRRRARARGVAAVHRRARHPDLPPLADRRPLPAAVPRGPLGRGPRGRRRRAGRRRHAAGDVLAAPGQRRWSPLRRGDEAPATHLEAAWELAEQLDEPLRRLPCWPRSPSGCG